MSAEKSLKVIAERLENIETLMSATNERFERIEEHLQTIAKTLKSIEKDGHKGEGPVVFGDLIA